MQSLGWFQRPRLFRRILNLWPPMLGAGISIQEISDDFRYGKVRLRMRWYNRNFMGTHFGGSLFAMTDMMYVFMLLRHLGKEHVVWDQSSAIQFLKPGRRDVFAVFRLTDEKIESIRLHAADGKKCLETFDVDVVDSDGNIVSRVQRTIYVRRKRKLAQSSE